MQKSIHEFVWPILADQVVGGNYLTLFNSFSFSNDKIQSLTIQIMLYSIQFLLIDDYSEKSICTFAKPIIAH